jgi:DNA-binding IclR family transcriptional regulator
VNARRPSRASAAAAKEDQAPAQGGGETVEVVSRVASILRSVADAPTGLTVSALSRASGVPRATAHRLVAALERERMLGRAGDGRLVVLGAGMARLAGGYLPGRDLLESGRPFVETLAAELREAAELAAVVDPSADDASDALEVLVRVESPFRLRVGGGGPPQPLHVTASGKALLAWGPPARADALLGFGGALQRYGPRTITDPEVLRREIDRVRIRGVATAVDELEEGVASAAAPVRRDGTLAGIIVVDGPTSRIAQARVLPRIVDRLAETARRVESTLARSADQ